MEKKKAILVLVILFTSASLFHGEDRIGSEFEGKAITDFTYPNIEIDLNWDGCLEIIVVKAVGANYYQGELYGGDLVVSIASKCGGFESGLNEGSESCLLEPLVGYSFKNTDVTILTKSQKRVVALGVRPDIHNLQSESTYLVICAEEDSELVAYLGSFPGMPGKTLISTLEDSCVSDKDTQCSQAVNVTCMPTEGGGK